MYYMHPNVKKKKSKKNLQLFLKSGLLSYKHRKKKKRTFKSFNIHKLNTTFKLKHSHKLYSNTIMNLKTENIKITPYILKELSNKSNFKVISIPNVKRRLLKLGAKLFYFF